MGPSEVLGLEPRGAASGDAIASIFQRVLAIRSGLTDGHADAASPRIRAALPPGIARASSSAM